MNHKMRDAQQCQAKTCASQLINKKQNFRLKILPSGFYHKFSGKDKKKILSRRVCRFILRDSRDSKYWRIYWRLFVKKLNNVLKIGQNVLKEFVHDCPAVINVFSKFDNVGCYHWNCIFEGKSCKKFNLILLWYD